MIDPPVYMDYNATTPCDPRVLEVMMPYFTGFFGNASSHNHAFGWQANAAVEYGREQVAALINAEPSEIVFTSGATEAVNLALKGVFATYRGKGTHIITCLIEHKAVLDSCAHLERDGAEITYLPVNNNGSINLDELEAACRPTTILIALMYANNETGNILPVADIARIAKHKGILFFCDATQAVGKIPVDVQRDGIDLLAFSAHKMYGPKGVGALYVRRKGPRVKLTPQLDGGQHEKGMRSGTLNVPGIAGFGKACELCSEIMDEETARISKLRNLLESRLLSIAGAAVNGDVEHRLPHVSNLSFRDGENDLLLARLSKTLAISSGSACMSSTLEPSYVLRAMGLSDEIARNSLRFSIGRFTTNEEIEYAIAEVMRVMDKSVVEL